MPGRYEASLRMNRGGAHRSRSLCNCVAVAPTMSATGAIYPKVSFAFGRSQTLCSVCLSRARQPFTPSDAFGIYRRRARLHRPAACRRRRRRGYTRWRASRSSSSPQGGYRPRPPCARAPRLSLSLSLPPSLSLSLVRRATRFDRSPGTRKSSRRSWRFSRAGPRSLAR